MDRSKKRIARIMSALMRQYPDARVRLAFNKPWELLVATILSAQCTDDRVNMVTPGLFGRYPSVESFASAGLEQIEQEIRSTGFFRNKAKAIRGSADMICRQFGGKVPDTMEELLKLPGVARKTANVVLSNAFAKSEGITVDTHVIRLAGRLGLTSHDDAVGIEKDLMQIVPRDKWRIFPHLLLFHGRAICTARKPKCDICPINKLCPSAFKA